MDVPTSDRAVRAIAKAEGGLHGLGDTVVCGPRFPLSTNGAPLLGVMLKSMPKGYPET